MLRANMGDPGLHLSLFGEPTEGENCGSFLRPLGKGTDVNC